MYRDERAVEVQTLSDPRVRALISEEEIELLSFGSVLSAPRV
jgi:predicted glycoside hydrolase/deacetylase ChbG (UPF0249 family)